MNNKGQVLILFVLIIPILLLGAVYIIDNTYLAYNKNKLNQINDLVIKDAAIRNMGVDEIKDYINKNDKDIEVEFILVSAEEVQINLKKEVSSYFGNVTGRNNYTITSKRTFKINNDNPIYQ